MTSLMKVSKGLAGSFFGICLWQTVYAEEQLPVKQETQQASHQSGYDDSEEFGGPSAVSSELDMLDENRDSLYQLDILTRGLDAWFEWKRERLRHRPDIHWTGF